MSNNNRWPVARPQYRDDHEGGEVNFQEEQGPVPTMVTFNERSAERSPSPTPSSYEYPRRPPTKTSYPEDNIMMDVTMDDSVHEYSENYDYPVEVDGQDPKRFYRRNSIRRSTLRSRCGWFPVLCMVGWVTALALFGALIHKLNREPDESEPVDDTFVVRLNTGSSLPHTDLQGNVWLADEVLLEGPPQTQEDDSIVSREARTVTDPRTGLVVYTLQGDGFLYNLRYAEPDRWETIPIQNVGAEGIDLYRDERFFNTTGNYEIFVPTSEIDAWYQVDLYFCEIYFNATNERRFNVYIEDELMEDQLDIVSVAGEHNRAVIRSHTVQVMDGAVSISFESLVDHAKISAIQVQLMR